ncbi:uncharacterized protein KY384_006092 [Bacidia gigantensis]|uniref:uncharacterized protein n=1 Tax=Bacidia gigantensis TaxID=2732470 RepID=UPI001D04D85E|nr:uncharacterized protein KY384_006092 [Bacidia gigantensis]KAG8529455.1 hypothetical protein KY384_006092 [Bacidia gigantensis]
MAEMMKIERKAVEEEEKASSDNDVLRAMNEPALNGSVVNGERDLHHSALSKERQSLPMYQGIQIQNGLGHSDQPGGSKEHNEQSQERHKIDSVEEQTLLASGSLRQPPQAPKVRDVAETPPPRPSVQFSPRPPTVDVSQNRHIRNSSVAIEEDDSNNKDGWGGSLLSRLKALTTSPNGQSHTRSLSSTAINREADGKMHTSRSPVKMEKGLQPDRYPIGNEDGDADVEESEGEGFPEARSAQQHALRFKGRRTGDGSANESSQTAPSTPNLRPKRDRPKVQTSISANPNDESRPTFIPRRATMSDIQDDERHGISEDEGRQRLSRQSPWRKGSAWINNARGNEQSTNRRQNERAESEERRPHTLRRLTGFGSTTESPAGSSFSPWRLHRGERATNLSSARWQRVKAGLKMLAQRRKAEHGGIDQTKSAELLAELTAGAPAVLILASMFQRDEHGNKRIPILLEQLKVRVTDRGQVDSKSGDRHISFRIELEYGNGLTRMRWVIHRLLREFAALHAKYKVQISAQKYIQLRGDERTKLPRFPRILMPYAKSLGFTGLDSESEEDGENDAEAPEANTGDASVKQRQKQIKGKKDRKPRPTLAHRRKSSVVSMAGDAAAQARREALPERQRKSIEIYLQQMIRYLIFRPECNRLCKFLELSALGVRLAAEGSYHGKEGLLTLKSGKGVDFRRAWSTPNPLLFVDRHRPKWFVVRHSYVVCVDSPEAMNIYDVFLVDSNFRVSAKRRRLRDQQKAKDMARAAKESAAHPQHHQLKLYNSERQIKLLARSERMLNEFQESILYMCTTSPWSKPKRFDSFAPIRSNCFAQWLVDGRDYMWNVSRAISMAKDVVYIHDWWLSPELYMRRPAAISQKWRLDRLLQRKAREGVKIFVLMYRNINSAIPIDSEYSKFSLLDLHPNIFVQRSPNQFRQNTFFWAHHEKLCLIDHMVAFVGGIDLCFGRWDTPQHTVADDKLTGFEPSDEPKDADHCQLWPGKDYSNPRVQDFYALDKPYEEMYDRSRVPRMPWHDIHMQIVGQPARDLTRHFVQRWNYILRQRKPTRPTPFLLPPPDFDTPDLRAVGLEGTCEIQILRSACEWSLGTPGLTEHSIMNAYIKLIEQSEHFVYIENQFFISSCEVEGTRMENKIGDALVERIIRAAQYGERWRAVIVIPLMPGFQNTVDNQDGSSIRLIMQCQFRSICRGEASIFGRVRAAGFEPEDYIQFYSLRSWGKIGPQKQLVTEQLYIHAKCMIVDDRIAIIGSANINERSMLGSRDSECAAVVRDTDMLNSTMDGEPYLVGRFAHTLRVRLMREHLGIDVDEVMEEEQRANETEHGRDDGQTSDDAATEPSDEESKRKAWESMHRRQDEMLLRSEQISSFNHDIDWEQSENPNLKTKRKLTEDPRVTHNEVHRKSVDGDGTDAMKREERAGNRKRRDSSLRQTTGGSKEILASLEGSDTPTKRLNLQSPHPKHADELAANVDLPPDFLLEKSASLGDLSGSSLPPLPTTDDTDIGGPRGKQSAVRIYLICFIPYYLDTWHAVAENNTKIYRNVFRCMPDNEVKTWKEYKEYASYTERFSQAQGGGKLSERVKRENISSSSGPPGTSSTADKLKLLGSIGEKAGQLDGQVESFGQKLRHSLGYKDPEKYPMGRVEEWAEEANKAQAERHEREDMEHEKRAKREQRGEMNSEKAFNSNDARQPGSSAIPNIDGTEHLPVSKPASPPSITYSDALNRNASTQKRRRRATTRSSRREFRASDDVIGKDDAEELMHMLRGHLVLWPYDWLVKEEQGGNWLYSIDALAPLEI